MSNMDGILGKCKSVNGVSSTRGAFDDAEGCFHFVEDSGERERFSTGAVRNVRTGRGRYDLISPIALSRLARHAEHGATKYSPRNWESGIPMSRFLDSAMRHLYQYLEGDRTEDHLSAAAWNAMAMVHTEECIRRGILPKELNDMPDYSVAPGICEAMDYIANQKESSTCWRNEHDVASVKDDDGIEYIKSGRTDRT